MKIFNALLVSEEEGKLIKEIGQLTTDQLPDDELLIKVSYSSLNFKDALSASGNRGVTKKYPHVPGIDAAGVIVESKTPDYVKGTEVIVTGFDLGMNTWGGFGEYIRVPASWIIPVPEGLSLKEAMCFGTAGLTAALSVHQIVERGITPQQGTIAVSGATGGVGSMATAILAKLGFEVTAISGKSEEQFILKTLGANQIIGRDEFITAYNSKPLAGPAFSGGIDSVGGSILSGMLKATQPGGTVTCCGMIASTELNTTIFPFILRGITLAGIDSVMAPVELRNRIWNLLAAEWKPQNLSDMVREIKLGDLPGKLDELLQGKAKGRYILAHD